VSDDEMGDRMKGYEAVATRERLDPSLPICARIDGRAFSGFTRGCERPFDARVSGAMRETTKYLVDETHAKIGYVQSDEITLIWQNTDGGSVFFDGRVQKLTSVLASMAGVKFYSVYGGNRLPAFDCRVWQVPSQEEAVNVLLWRAFDARKNAVFSAARAHFSPKQMHLKRQPDLRAMLASVGVDFDTHYPAEDRHGVFYRRVTGQREMDDATWAAIPERHRPASRDVVRSWVEPISMPFFGDVANRVDVVFNGAAPTATD
jgi:tRNA(His) guanylyltransferase